MLATVRTAAVVLALALPAAAEAAVVTVTYTGTVTRAAGDAEPFGAPSADLVGLAYTAVYRFDSSLGQRMVAPTFESTFGGTNSGIASPWLSSTLTINGQTVVIGGQNHSLFSTANGGNFGRMVDLAFYDAPNQGFSFHRTEMKHDVFTPAVGSSIGVGFDHSYTYQIAPADTVQAYYSLLLATPENPVCCSATGALRPETVTVSVAPEPAIWAMMLLGFGVMGGALRRAGASAPLARGGETERPYRSA